MIKQSELIEARNEMNFFKNMNKKETAAILVKKGLTHRKTVRMKEIMDCMFLLANALGETWKSASTEAAAGMVLIVLAKNAMLKNSINAAGWRLVINFFDSNPEIARDISPRALAEINAYRTGRMGPGLQTAA